MHDSPAPDPPWWTSRQPRDADNDPRTEIVETALRIADDEGLTALSLRRVAAELGVGKTTIVWHVGSKEQLLDLVLDRILAEVPLPPPSAQPKDALQQLALGLRMTLLSHRKIAPLVGDRPGIGPNSLALIEQTLAWLTSAGLDIDQAVHSYVALLAYVNGFAVWESRNIDTAIAIGPDLYAATIHSYLSQLPQATYPVIRAAAAHMTDGDFDTRFEQGLTWILDGILDRTEGAGLR